jgi:hypothetical protein
MPTDRVMSSTLYKVEHGQIERISIGERGRKLRPDASVNAKFFGRLPVALRGEQNRHFDDWTINKAREMVTTITPWLTAFFAPEFREGSEVQKPITWAGTSYIRRDAILIKTMRSPCFVLPMVAHECWHSLEELMTDAEIAAVDRECAGGLDWPEGYYASALERRARAFEGYVSLVLETGITPSATRCDRLFRAALTGRVGLRGARKYMARHEWAPETRAVDTWRSAAADLGDRLNGAVRWVAGLPGWYVAGLLGV